MRFRACRSQDTLKPFSGHLNVSGLKPTPIGTSGVTFPKMPKSPKRQVTCAAGTPTRQLVGHNTWAHELFMLRLSCSLLHALLQLTSNWVERSSPDAFQSQTRGHGKKSSGTGQESNEGTRKKRHQRSGFHADKRSLGGGDGGSSTEGARAMPSCSAESLLKGTTKKKKNRAL